MANMEEIYQAHARTVYKFLLSQCHDADLAEELTQETFYQAVRSIDRFNGSCKVSVWLCQIAKHLWYQHLRKRKPEAVWWQSHACTSVCAPPSSPDTAP